MDLRIKKFCVSCGYRLEMTEARYDMDGNFCPECTARAGNVIAKKISREQADILLEKRYARYGKNLLKQ